MAKRKLTEMEIVKRDRDRDLKVYKHDTLIQKARMNLTLQEQKCVLYAISKIHPEDKEFKEYPFEIKDFYALCGIEDESYTRLKATLKKLADRSWWAETDDGEESLLRWFSVVKTNKNSGKVIVKFHEQMMPYLLQLAENNTFYTKYSLQYVLPMQSQYSPRLYEILKSYEKNNREWFFDVETLKKLLDCQNYERWPDFRRFAVEPAVEEINKYTDLNIAYDVGKDGRKVTRIYFFMAKKKPSVLAETRLENLKKLNGISDYQEYKDEIATAAEDSVRVKFWRENK